MRLHLTRSMLGNTATLVALVVLALWLLSLQGKPWPAVTPLSQPRIAAAIAMLAYLGFCGWMLWRSRQQRDAAQPHNPSAAAWQVAYASQTGFALELAQRTVESLRDAGHDAALRDIGKVQSSELQRGNWLFVVSTTGEGDPPDHALAFAGRTLGSPDALGNARYAVLALGDRSYANYCAFGHQLDVWLRSNGARPLFDLVEVDNADPAALRHWQHHLGVLTGHTGQPDWDRPQYQRWTLATRTLLNPGSTGGPAFHLQLTPPASADAQWQAGDIAEIGPRNPSAMVERFLAARALDADAAVQFQQERMPLREALARARLPSDDASPGETVDALAAHLQPLPHREYSISSIPADGGLDLLVRLMQREDGSPGIGSGWLCEYAAPGDAIDLRIRSNPNFHAPPASTPMILIGNGTGLAGLRAHLKARVAQGASRNWLLFGERSQAHDGFHADELVGCLRDGQLAHLDRVFSRDGGTHRYVQDALRAQAERLQAWLDEGAAIYVCGSLDGMAPGVDAVLVELLGQPRVDALLETGRYRRDVY